MTAPYFRYAVQADVPALVALIERAYRSPETAVSWASEAHLLTGPRTSDAEISDLIAQPDARFIIAERDNIVLGCCLIQKLDVAQHVSGGLAYFGMFAIDPASHSHGLGKLMIAEAERRAQALWRAKAMVMTVINLRDELIAYYRRRGYALTGATMPFPFSDTTGEVHRNFYLVEMRKDFC